MDSYTTKFIFTSAPTLNSIKTDMSDAIESLPMTIGDYFSPNYSRDHNLKKKQKTTVMQKKKKKENLYRQNATQSKQIHNKIYCMILAIIHYSEKRWSYGSQSWGIF